MAAYYINSFESFLADDTDKIIGILTQKGGDAGFYQQLHSQTLSWRSQIDILKSSLKHVLDAKPEAIQWALLLEYAIVRRAKRIDAVILSDNIIVVEFKIGKETYGADAEEQLLDYSLDLRDFHYESRNRKIFPILVASEGENPNNEFLIEEDQIFTVQYANKKTLASVLINLPSSAAVIERNQWDSSIYSPTPTIIEAAQTLFSGKDVIEITRSHAGEKNLTKTTSAVIDAINNARKNNEKIICFITGVPGAGKTLAGLNIAHHIEYQNEKGSLATFLSGNAPLIKVLRGALSKDAQRRLKKAGKDTNEKEQERIIAFIENVHRFIDGYFLTENKPETKIVIFDEAQRAWNAEQSKRKFNRDFSEPEMLFDIMDRHNDWAVVVALVGGGQEINTGEAGLPEWGRVLSEKYSHWKIYISNELKEGNHSTGNLTLFEKTPDNLDVIEDSDLHLNVSIRSYKAEKLSQWVALVLDNKPTEAKDVLINDLKNYRIAITRDLNKAKGWLRLRCKGSRRMGLVASSGARRLRPHGIEVKLDLEEKNWFLNSKEDVRSSNFLEIPATEFGVQGLELDWAGVCWDADLQRENGEWQFRNFSGTKWNQVKGAEDRKYILNTYRVLLTRAREGMVIWIPNGDEKDKTRDSKVYTDIYKYLKSCGIEEV